MSKKKLPAPPTPADTNLTGTEPPWDLFAGMAVTQFGISEDEAREYVNKLRAEYQEKRKLQ